MNRVMDTAIKDRASRPQTPMQDQGGTGKTLKTPKLNTVIATVVVAAMLGYGLWSLAALKINVATLVDSIGNAQSFMTRMLPLDFPALPETAALIAQTMAIVIAATLLSTVLSIPLAFWAAGNTSRGMPSRTSSRAFVVAMRAIPDVVMAIIFVRIFGLGILPGVLAMGLHSIGMIAKLYADAIEQVDEGPPTAIRATGSRRLQRLVSGVFPQVLPSFVATAMHRLDINLRISVLLGFVGVAGIGKEIADALGRLDYQRGMALALIVLILCIVMELISGAIRRSIMGSSEPTRGGPLWLWKRLTGGASPKPTAQRVTAATKRVSPPWTSSRIIKLCYGIVATTLIAVSVLYVLRDAMGAAGGVGVWETLSRLWPPDTGGIGMGVLVEELVLTIQIAFGATTLGMVMALPVGVMAARNVAPNLFIGKVFRIFIVCVRGVPELVLAVVFVIMIGLGAVAGTLALAIGSIGLLGKLVADSVEEVDPGVEQALRATGAGRVQVFFSATLPQALPAFVGHLLYQLDVNIRSATLLGIVGAGGIGYYLLEASRVREFGTVTLITLMVFGVVMVLELIAVWLRRSVGAKS